MISHIRGTVLEIGDGFIVVDTTGGLGYRVFCPARVIGKLSAGDDLGLYTHLAVRENSQDLYGFTDRRELNMFELLIDISGIGPKAGIAILEAATVDTLVSAVRSQDHSILTKVSGIGPKNAQKIILELQNKIDRLGDANAATDSIDDLEVFEALEALGFDRRAIQATLKSPELADLDSQAKIRQAIKLLG